METIVSGGVGSRRTRENISKQKRCDILKIDFICNKPEEQYLAILTKISCNPKDRWRALLHFSQTLDISTRCLSLLYDHGFCEQSL